MHATQYPYVIEHMFFKDEKLNLTAIYNDGYEASYT
jgi:hypothetical protein